jgi:hypothetical protein
VLVKAAEAYDRMMSGKARFRVVLKRAQRMDADSFQCRSAKLRRKAAVGNSSVSDEADLFSQGDAKTQRGVTRISRIDTKANRTNRDGSEMRDNNACW